MRVAGAALLAACCAAAVLLVGAGRPPGQGAAPGSSDEALRPLPAMPLGIDHTWEDLAQPPTPERVRLGRWLFFDTRLSSDGQVACASCHRPAHGFSEPEAVSTGVHGRRGRRKALPAINQAFPIFPRFFWDGRAASLEEQARGPLANPLEMDMPAERLEARVAAIRGYAPHFTAAFGDAAVTLERIARALADYQRTLVSGDSDWDRWQRHRDATAVSDAVRRGHDLFFGAAGCNQCHLGSSLTDGQFHNVGIGWIAAERRFLDEGRFEVTQRDADRGAFKTPTLRDVARRAPYMHDGSLPTLRAVVEHYQRGGSPNPWLSPRIVPLALSARDVDDLVALLEALNGRTPVESPPRAFPE